jgi:putative peptidoglycan lipid II flippase
MARSSLLVMGAFIISKVVGLLRERAIGFQFGVSSDYDAYVAAFRVPDLLFTLIAGGALVSAFLPVFAAALARDEEDDAGAWRLASAVTNLVFLVTAVLSGFSALTAPWLATVIAPGFTPDQQALTADLMRVILLSTCVFAVSGIQMGMLNAYQHFLTPAIAPIVYNGGILVGALWLAPRFGVFGLAWGVVLGAVGHLVVKIPALLRHGFRWQPVLDLRDAGLRRVLWLMWPRVLSMFTVQLVFLINTRLASQIESGSVAALNYAWVISQMPQTILGTAIATVAFPTLAELAAKGRKVALRTTFVDALRVMMALSVPAAVALLVLAGPVIAVLLQTGRFGPNAAAATQLALEMFALGLVGHVTFEVVARVFYAQQDTLTPLYIGAAAMAFNIALAYLLVGPLAQGGLALANSIAVSVEVWLALMILRKRLGRVGGRELAGTLARALAAAAMMALAMTAVLGALPEAVSLGPLDGPFVDGVVRMGLGAVVGGAVYLAAALALGMPEARAGVRWVRGRLGA